MKLEVKNISKTYSNGFRALTNFSIDIETGVLGLLGPNGAGKSTLMRILSTISTMTEGQVLLNDIDITQNPNYVRGMLGYLPQSFGVYPNLTAEEFLRYIGTLKGLEKSEINTRVDELLTLVNLQDSKDRAVGGFSGGMKQRVGIAQALLNDPKLLIVDEPTVGLDPEERARFRNLIAELSGDRIVILSTHIVSDVEATASDIAVINAGENVTTTSPEDLLKSVTGKVHETVVQQDGFADIREKYIVSSMIRRSDGIHVRIVTDEAPDNSKTVIPSLEDAYLYTIETHRSNHV
ncbi:MAG: ABC transporter ATP-binding protein [Candidatus Kariarchaeaceae archaeon]|jgi:ABC-type multidrug transport system ATPase subunit